jgi:hypothetical protein
MPYYQPSGITFYDLLITNNTTEPAMFGTTAIAPVAPPVVTAALTPFKERIEAVVLLAHTATIPGMPDDQTSIAVVTVANLTM